MRHLEQQIDLENIEQLSPMTSSPIHRFETSNKKDLEGSPSEMCIQFCPTGSFKKIVQKDNEDDIDNESNNLSKFYQGKTICEFTTGEENQFLDQVLPIIEDKENDVPSTNYHLQTPLKNKQLRSPLKDITPSITKKRKSELKTISEKQMFLTPRTMAQSRFSSGSGLRRIERL